LTYQILPLWLWVTLPAFATTNEVDWKKTGEEARELLSNYIRIDTSNPPGDVARAADYLSGVLEREGLQVTRVTSAPGKVNLYSRLQGQGQQKPILLLHHMDVVPADKTRWSVDPFEGQEQAGELWGRGAMDMKGLGVVHLLSFLTLKRQAIALDRDVIFMAVADEEVGGALGARYMIEKHYAELDPEYVLDEGGFGSPDAFVDGTLIFGISVAEKKIVWLKLTAEGVAGHGSQPHAQNPNDRLARALARLVSEPFPTAPVPLLDELKTTLGPLVENKFTRAIQHSTISLTTLRSGVGDPPKVNVIPSLAEATLDCRLLPGVTTENWVITPHQTVLYRSLESAIRRHHPEATTVPILIPYGTDSNAFRQKGAKSYGLLPMALSADIVATMHGDAERIPVEGLTTAIRIFYEAIGQAAGGRR
jgi:acetylornithine deacetylase/succinyl-diaminopimelate desuccinylase-like protein